MGAAMDFDSTQNQQVGAQAYLDALHTIFGRVNFERQPRFDYSASTLNLRRMETLLLALGDPHRRYRIVHVAGTKGKGSVCAFTEAILRAAGLCTGLYTSPHLHTLRERMRVNGALISRAELTALVEHCRPAFEATPGVTTFELLTSLALTHFAQQRAAWVVLEVGLGGRLDATNVVQPAVTVITSLSLDHMAVLGDTLTQIAHEKAGIIKPGVPVICAPQAPEALAVIEETCRARQAPLLLLQPAGAAPPAPAGAPPMQLWRYSMRKTNDRFWVWPDAAAPKRRQAAFAQSLAGPHQAVNASLAVMIAETLGAQGVPITRQAVRRGLRATRWPARFERLTPAGVGPLIVVDGAHNVDSAQKLAALLCDARRQRGGSLILIVGAALDKDVHGILAALAPVADRLICTQARHPRAAAPADLAAIAAQLLAVSGEETAAPGVLTAPTTTVALQDALRLAEPAALICLTGSLFIAAEGREAWAQHHPEHFAPDDWVFEAEALSL